MKHRIVLLAALSVFSSTVLLSACGTSKKDAAAQTPAMRQSGVIADSIVSSNVKAALAADADLSSTKIAVETISGKVILRGEIKSMVLRKKAEAIVKDIDGVSVIDNRLVITG